MDTRKLTANGRYIDDEGGALVAQVEVESIDNNPDPEATAAEMVRRYNNFPALVEALEEMTETGGWMRSDERYIKARALLATLKA
jgi:hypothetical protein